MHDLSIARIYMTIMSVSKLCFPFVYKESLMPWRQRAGSG